MGAGQGQAESSGGSTGSAGAPVSRQAEAAGKGCGWLMGWKCEEHLEIGKWKLKNCAEKISTHAVHEWGTRPIFNYFRSGVIAFSFVSSHCRAEDFETDRPT